MNEADIAVVAFTADAWLAAADIPMWLSIMQPTITPIPFSTANFNSTSPAQATRLS